MAFCTSRLMNTMPSSHSLQSDMRISKVTNIELLQLSQDQIARVTLNRKEESFNREFCVHHYCLKWKRFYPDYLLYFQNYKIEVYVDRTLDDED